MRNIISGETDALATIICNGIIYAQFWDINHT